MRIQQDTQRDLLIRQTSGGSVDLKVISDTGMQPFLVVTNLYDHLTPPVHNAEN